MEGIRHGASYEKNSISKLLLELKKSMVGVPQGGLGSRPVLSELAGVYGVLLHGAPDAEALAQLPVEPLRVDQGGEGSIESRHAVGGGVATGAGLVQGNDPITDGFTARAFTLRTQGLGDHADALEALAEHVMLAPRPITPDALMVLLALSGTSDYGHYHASAHNREPLPLGRMARAALAQQRARNQPHGSSRSTAAEVALPAQPDRFFANSFLPHRNANADFSEHRSHFGGVGVGVGIGRLSENTGQVNDLVGISSSSGSGEPHSHHGDNGSAHSSSLAPLPLPPSLTSGTGAFALFPNRVFESGLGDIGGPPSLPLQRLSNYGASSVHGSVIGEHGNFDDDNEDGAFDDDNGTRDGGGSDGSRDHFDDEVDLGSEHAGSSVFGQSEHGRVGDRHYQGGTCGHGASQDQASYEGFGGGRNVSGRSSQQIDMGGFGGGHGGEASSSGGFFGASGEGLDLNLFAALPGAGLSSALTSDHRTDASSLPPNQQGRSSLNGRTPPLFTLPAEEKANDEGAYSTATLAPVSDLFGALHHRPVSTASHAFRHMNVALALPELPEAPLLGVDHHNHHNANDPSSAPDDGGGHDDGAREAEGNTRVVSDNHDERSVDSWGVYRDALGLPSSTFARPASLTARALAHHTARSGNPKRSSSLHLNSAKNQDEDRGLLDTRSEVSLGSIKSHALSVAASQRAHRKEAALLNQGFAVPASGWDRALALSTTYAANAAATTNAAPSFSSGLCFEVGAGCPSESSHVSAFSGGVHMVRGGGAPSVIGGGGYGTGNGSRHRREEELAPTLAPPPLVSQAGLEAFETCYRAYAEHSLAAPPQVLPAATVAGLALQALTGTPSPPFLDLQPALIPSINMSSSSSGSNGGKESREWWCNNWRLEVAPTTAAGCRLAGCSALATQNALREFALAGTAAHRVGCFVRCFTLSNAENSISKGSSTIGCRNGGSSSSSGSRNGQIIAALAAAAATLLDGYRMEILALAEAWQLKETMVTPQSSTRKATTLQNADTRRGTAAAATPTVVPHSLAAMLTATRSLRRGLIRLAQLLGCGAHLQAPHTAAAAAATAASNNDPQSHHHGSAAASAAAATAPTPASFLLSSLSVAGPAMDELRVIFKHFPRGPALLSYLYSQAALEQDNDSDSALASFTTTGGGGALPSGSRNNVTGKLATALFVAGLKPYLTLCSKWLFALGPLGLNQDEAGEFPLSEVASVLGGLSLKALGSVGGGGSQFFQRTFVGRTMLPSSSSSSSVATAATAPSDPSMLPLTHVSLTGVSNKDSIRSHEAARKSALTNLLPSFLRHHAAGLALLRAGMVLRLVLAANPSHDGLDGQNNHRAHLALDLSPCTRKSSRVLCHAIDRQVAVAQQAFLVQRQAAKHAMSAMLVQQKRAAKLRVAKREAQRLEEELAASKARRAKQEAHRATLEAHLADTKKRRADAAAEAQKAEIAAQEATAARRAALASEALEALLDKYSVLEKGAEARLQHAKRLLQQLDDDATRTLDAKAVADRALSGASEVGATSVTNSGATSGIARRHARLTARLAMASSFGGGARTEADAYAALLQEQRQKRRLRRGSVGGLRMPGGNSTATATLLAPGGALGAPDTSVGAQNNRKSSSISGGNGAAGGHGSGQGARRDVGGAADGARRAIYGDRDGDSTVQDRAISVKVSGNGMGGGSAGIGKVMYGYDDGEERSARADSTVKVIGNGMGGGGNNAQRAMYGNADGGEDDEDPAKSQASVKVTGNGMGGSGTVDHARQALYGYQEGDERVHEDSSVKVLGNGMGGGSDGIQKALYGYDDGEERVRAAPSVKVSGDGAGGGGDGARMAMYGNADGVDEDPVKSQASVKVAGNGMGGSGTVDHARQALYGYQEGDERVHEDSSVKVLGNGMGGGSDGIQKALYGYDDGEGREKVKASTLSVKISDKGLGGGESTSVERHAASVKVRGDGMGGKKRDQNGIAGHEDIFHSNPNGHDRKFKPSVKVSGLGVGSDGASAAKSLYGQQEATHQNAPGWVDDDACGEGQEAHETNNAHNFFSAAFAAPAAFRKNVPLTGQTLPWGLPKEGSHSMLSEESTSPHGVSFLDTQWANALGRCRRQPSFAAAVQSLLGASSTMTTEEDASTRTGLNGHQSQAAQFMSSVRSPPLQLLVEECVFEPILHASAAADRAAVALMLRGGGGGSSKNGQAKDGATLGKHLSALHTLMLAGQGSGSTFFELADRLIERFGDASHSELLFFKQSVHNPVLPPATAATAAAAAAVAANQARQARRVATTSATAPASVDERSSVTNKSISTSIGNKYGGDDGSTVRSDDFVGRVLTSLLVEAAQANHLGVGLRIGGERGVDDVGGVGAIASTANVAGSGSCMDSASLKRYAFVPSEMVSSVGTAAAATAPTSQSTSSTGTAAAAAATTLLGDVLTKALPGLLGQARSLRCRYDVPWPLGVLLDEHSMALYEAAHAKLLAHHLCLAMLRKTFQVLSLTSSALDDNCHRFGRPGFGSRPRAHGGGARSSLLAHARQQLHCLHLLRHQLFFVANSLTDHFAFEIESSWEYLNGVLDEDNDDEGTSNGKEQHDESESDSSESESDDDDEDDEDEQKVKALADKAAQDLAASAAGTAAGTSAIDDADDAGTDGEDAGDEQLAHVGTVSAQAISQTGATAKVAVQVPAARAISAKKQAKKQARASAKLLKQKQQRAAKQRAKADRAAARAARCPRAHNLQDLKNAHDGYLERVRSALFLAPLQGREDSHDEEPSAAALRAEVLRFHALVSSVHAAIASLHESLNQINGTNNSPSSPTNSSSDASSSSSASPEGATMEHHQKALAVAQAVSDAFTAIHGGAPRVLGEKASAASSQSTARGISNSTDGGSSSYGSSYSSSAAVAEHALGSSGQQLARLVVRFCDALHNARSNRCFGTSRSCSRSSRSTTSTSSSTDSGNGQFNFFDKSGRVPMGGMGGGPAAGLAYSALAERLGAFFLKCNKSSK